MGKERPILFSAPMIVALLDGRKSMTRRQIRIDDMPLTAKQVGKRQRGIPSNASNVRLLGEYLKCDAPDGSATASCRVTCPYGFIGDTLWVRETWWHNESIPGANGVAYRADGEMPRHMEGSRWRPSIFMPRWASRITLEITGIKVERVADISEDDAKAEGISTSVVDPCPRGEPFNAKNYGTARDAFADLWRIINGDASWESNPWCWCISFKKVDHA